MRGVFVLGVGDVGGGDNVLMILQCVYMFAISRTSMSSSPHIPPRHLLTHFHMPSQTLSRSVLGQKNQTEYLIKCRSKP